MQEVNPELVNRLRSYTYDIIGACQEVHQEMGPFLNEYMYQEALDIEFDKRGIKGENKKKEYRFKASYKDIALSHTHQVDFLIRNNVFVECKAIECLGPEQRQQLWNYMRLAGIKVGILYNFYPSYDQCERYYLDTVNNVVFAF